MTKRKPDAADRIAAREYLIDKWSSGDEYLYALAKRGPLACHIRRAINAAVKADRKRRKR